MLPSIILYIMELSLSQILRSVPYSFCTLEAFRILSILWSVYGCPRRNRPVSSLYTSTYLKSSQLRKENSDVWCRLRAKREGANGSGHFFRITMPFCASPGKRVKCESPTYPERNDDAAYDSVSAATQCDTGRDCCSPSGHVLRKCVNGTTLDRLRAAEQRERDLRGTMTRLTSKTRDVSPSG